MRHAPYELAAEFDRRLGDPSDAGRLFSHARCAALDDREEFPQEICRELDVLGLPAHYVPTEHGGTLRSYEEAVQLMRAVARRDLTVAIAHGKTFLGAVSVWVGGDRDQADALGAEIAGGTIVSWGLTEREHGSDLLAGEVLAERVADGYRVSGEKWLINNGTRGHLVCLLARTARDAGPRSFGILLVDKRKLDPASYRTLPAERLHGIRGADISGIAFADAAVPGTALVGPEGGGVEIVLKSLQLTRTLCASLSLGAADHALRLGTDYALRRENYGSLLIDLPQSRRLLALSYADLLLAEAVTVVASRGIHALTGELGVISAATKFFVPNLVEQAVKRLAKLMGSRALLVGDTHEHGRFQKVQRDHRIVGIFDGNSVVNLHSLVNQFPLLAKSYRRGTVDAAGLTAATTLTDPLPEFDRDRLTLLARGGCSVVQALPAGVAELTALVARGEVPESLERTAIGLKLAADELLAAIAAQRPAAVDVPAEAFDLAERYTACFAAAAAIQLWLRNRATVVDGPAGALWRSGLWLEAALTRLLGRLRPARPDGTDDVFERLVEPLVAQHEAGQLLSLLPYQQQEARR
ncbi:acyl-CoA dehydrogenase family protein [Solihabitans fulvus]|uniref:Acyl-CoA dehydrogenase family protein n=1 Tax=Solihabitans fulvus TaxID=1892852 RepID=A0A5B2X347_9PSEU|nr:acyl-CoA dehydrogenase family protein [Solihabitans fulvus]KAA2257573.1 acyl-CoA dehydrogenase family protein [Solihabitans fulvus]